MPVMEQIESPESRRGLEIWLDEPVLVDIQKRAAHVAFRLSSKWPESALELRTRDRVTQNEWNHITVASDGSGKAAGITLYVNGISVATDVVRDQLSAPVTAEAEWRIGVKEPDAKPFTGGLDDLRFYNRSLTAEEIRDTAIDYPIRSLLSGVGGQPSKADNERIRDFYLRYVGPEKLRQQYAELKAYVRNFGIENFGIETQLLWDLAKLSEKLGPPGEAVLLYKLVLKHHKQNIDEKQVRQR